MKIKKTAFFTGTTLMQFTRMPQGFKNSPAVFQRAMTLILKDLVGKACLIYVDDILILEEMNKNMMKISD